MFLNKNEKILYIGKSKNLHKRVANYFLKSKSLKITKLIAETKHIKFMITNSNKESLLLEQNLINKHKPRFNVLLQDDKKYPYIQITKGDNPKLNYVRSSDKTKGENFGPFPDGFSAREFLKLLNKIFPFRKCYKIPKKTCIYYDIGQCLAPCINKVDTIVYERMKQQIRDIFDGNITQIKEILLKKMFFYSDKEEYESANKIKNIILNLEEFVKKQNVILPDSDNVDVISAFSKEGFVVLNILIIRFGKLINQFQYFDKIKLDTKTDLKQIINQYYSFNMYPKKILSLEDYGFYDVRNFGDCKITVPVKGEKKELINLSLTNAKNFYNLEIIKHSNKETERRELKETFEHLTGIKGASYFEMFDNSHHSGQNMVSGKIVMKNYKLEKNLYRKYILRHSSPGNDVEAMYEAVHRSTFRHLSQKENLPDIIFVDGGKPQVNAAQQALTDLSTKTLVLGLVKNERHQTEALLTEKGKRILEKGSALYKFLGKMQDNCHNYIISFSRQKQRKSMLKSFLDDISGVGEKRKQLLIKKFTTISKLKNCSFQDLQAVLPKNVAEKVFFHVTTNL